VVPHVPPAWPAVRLLLPGAPRGAPAGAGSPARSWWGYLGKQL